MINRIFKNWRSSLVGLLTMIGLTYLGIRLNADFLIIILGDILFLSFLFATDDYFVKIWDSLDRFINKR